MEYSNGNMNSMNVSDCHTHNYGGGVVHLGMGVKRRDGGGVSKPKWIVTRREKLRLFIR